LFGGLYLLSGLSNWKRDLHNFPQTLHLLNERNIVGISRDEESEVIVTMQEGHRPFGEL
jgi:hypothetical protein